MIKTVIADDHPIVRAGSKQILADASDIEVAAEAGGGHERIEPVASPAKPEELPSARLPTVPRPVDEPGSASI